MLSILVGCATTKTTNNLIEEDTLEPANRVFFDINESIDKALIKPIAETYVDVTPNFIRTSITNFFDNLAYLNVILNSLLQGKVEQGFSDAMRFVSNTTLGIGGLFDVATTMGFAENNEDFGQTLAVWGVDEGSYLYIPFFGPNTVRDSTDFVPSTLLNPFYYISSAMLFPITAINAVNKRANLLEASNIRDEAAVDPYSFTREAHLQQREYLIHDGNPPITGYEDIFDADDSQDNESGILKID
ncbi:MAG: VacJ family lipoprotein [Gammaproteobacteria bacterium]